MIGIILYATTSKMSGDKTDYDTFVSRPRRSGVGCPVNATLAIIGIRTEIVELGESDLSDLLDLAAPRDGEVVLNCIEAPA